MDDKCIMENLLLTTKGVCDLYLHGTIESSTCLLYTSNQVREPDPDQPHHRRTCRADGRKPVGILT